MVSPTKRVPCRALKGDDRDASRRLDEKLAKKQLGRPQVYDASWTEALELPYSRPTVNIEDWLAATLVRR